MVLTYTTKSLYQSLECSKSEESYDKDTLQTYSNLSKPLVAKYDLSTALDKAILEDRPLNMWRYRELLPIENVQNIVTLDEGMTPLLSMEQIGKSIGVEDLWLKDEALNPTGSFKARGLAMAISKAKEFGVNTCVIPTAGNAGGAMSAYCAKAGMRAIVYMPEETPSVFKKECEFFGAEVIQVKGTISDCGKRIKQDRQPDWFDVSTLKEPFRLEGKKTMGLEIAEQFNWELPDVIVYPTGGGTGLIGIWKAFKELAELGWIDQKIKTRMVVVQSNVCYPIVAAFEQQQKEAPAFKDPKKTIANGLRVPKAFGDEMILNVLNESKGTAISISDQDMLAGVKAVAQNEGVLLSPEGAAVFQATKALKNTGWIKSNEKVVMLNTGSMYKYMENV